MKLSIGVSELATFVHRRGDINYRFEDSTQMHEGIRAQQQYQEQQLKEFQHYSREHRLSQQFVYKDLQLNVSGRADGILLNPTTVVEEVKTTRKHVENLFQSRGTEHVAQARLYAAMLLTQETEVQDCEVKVTYVHPDTLSSKSFKETVDRDELKKFFLDTCTHFASFILAVMQRIELRNTLATTQEIPFKTVAEEQRNLARRVYMSIRDREDLMFEAPTGTGKTVATLFPAVKAMGANLVDRVIFTTARTTGQRVVHDTMKALSLSNEHVRSIVITAKDRICFTPGATCAPENCEFARGHFDRIQAARKDLLAHPNVDQKLVQLVAQSHKVCPFELSLDTAEWCDIVVGDYNYVFDPFVALQRLHSRLFKRVGVLVDEAHRLGSRVADMLSAELSLELLRRVNSECPIQDIRSITKKLIQWFETAASNSLSNEEEFEISVLDEKFWQLIEAFIVACEDVDVESTKESVFRCWSAILRMHDTRTRYDFESYICLMRREEEDLTLVLRCIAPASWIRATLKEYSGSVRFSGTLSPAKVFEASHGVSGPFVRAQSKPDPHRFGVMLVPDISTYWNDRERSINEIVKVIEDIRSSTTGNWLVAYPSFEYLERVFDVIENRDAEVLKQKANMTVEERAEFIEWMNEPNARIGFTVMGGVFTESVDFEPTALAGVVVVGPSIPPSSLELDKLRSSTELGFELAYRQPAMTRVVQAAGRVVRHANDRGIIILIDPRFTRTEYQQYFPMHWDAKFVKTSQIRNALDQFWKGELVSATSHTK
ncbi:MAG: hypothetical protein OXH31_02840 [Gammaproteobacteria bacterium]|nr:hypothetical protein [Gammaproteobacteria bacterium]